MNAPESLPSRARLEDLVFDNTFAALPETFYTRLPPLGLPQPRLVAASADAAALIGIDPGEFARPEFAELFCGNALPAGSDTLAAVYSGHQFGVWAGQLGDGRAHLLGGLTLGGAHWEIQLKGAGRTPYSRGADGRAVLRSSIREFLCSEAMSALGIPTTRALSVVAADLPVIREEVETAAVVARLSPSFVRFGSFEHWAARGRTAELQRLADYVIDTFRPECRDARQRHIALLGDVARRTGELVADWMAVGFMHGVMNTDNMSILGLTLDYGPFGFMDAFDAGHVCNHSDTHGRYAYNAQPAVAQWNLYCLAQAFLPLIGERDAAVAAVDEHYGPAFEARFASRLRAKLGLRAAAPDDEEFIGKTFALLQAQRLDFTGFFRALCALPGAVDPAAAPATDAPLRDQFVDRAAGDAWLSAWRARLAQTPWDDAPRQAAMRAANPKYVLRNWVAEQAIRAARAGDTGEVARVLACLRRPFDEQPEFAAYAAPPPDWAQGLEVSCSS
jgi:uncharacterized protein YdiU (UPF0061 family)